ncbi:enhanced serine sensitivity protein SseB C-terminal domain-containing protein, partial [uncultured Holdemanella sp.]
VSENPIHKGDSLKLRDPIASVTELQRAICEFGDSHPDILSIYLKERIVKDQPSHWFLVVDMINDDKQTLQDLGNFCTPASYGKGFEFMFGSMEIAKRIMADTIPTYVKVTK